MFPLSDSITQKGFPYVTILFILLSVFVFFQEIFVQDTEEFVMQFALVPDAVLRAFSPESFYPFVTSIFLHGGFFHILSNMWFLWIFGDNVELKVGRVNYVLLFLLSGIVGNIFQYILNPQSQIPILGASGAVSGILGAYYVLFPHARIRSVVLLFFLITIVNIPAAFYIFYWFLIQLLSGIASLPSLQYESGGVAFFAHIGGFLTGLALTKRVFNRPKKEYIEGEIVG